MAEGTAKNNDNYIRARINSTTFDNFVKAVESMCFVRQGVKNLSGTRSLKLQDQALKEGQIII